MQYNSLTEQQSTGSVFGSQSSSTWINALRWLHSPANI